jgi:hypothetical protein
MCYGALKTLISFGPIAVSVFRVQRIGTELANSHACHEPNSNILNRALFVQSCMRVIQKLLATLQQYTTPCWYQQETVFV